MAKIRSDDSNYPSRYSPNKDENGIAWVTDRQYIVEVICENKAAKDNKETDLISFDDEIKALLEQEIASRYFLQEGAIESTFTKDKDILAAVEILNDERKYESLINPF